MEGGWGSLHLGESDDDIFGKVFELFFRILKILARIWILRIKGVIKIFKRVDVRGEGIFEDGQKQGEEIDDWTWMVEELVIFLDFQGDGVSFSTDKFFELFGAISLGLEEDPGHF